MLLLIQSINYNNIMKYIDGVYYSIITLLGAKVFYAELGTYDVNINNFLNEKITIYYFVIIVTT